MVDRQIFLKKKEVLEYVPVALLTLQCEDQSEVNVRFLITNTDEFFHSCSIVITFFILYAISHFVLHRIANIIFHKKDV